MSMTANPRHWVRARWLLLAIVVGLTACAATPRPEVGFDPAAPFAAYRSFAWHPLDPVDTSQLLRVFTPGQEKTLRERVEAHLTEAGCTRASDSTAADFIIKLTDGRRQEVSFDKISVPDIDRAATVTTRRGRFEVQRGVYVSSGKKQISTTEVYTEGSISLDIYDNQTNAPVWSGHVSNEIDPVQGLSQNRDMAERALERLLEAFPPG